MIHPPEIRIHPKDKRMERILARCASIKKGYIPTFWCSGTFSQLIWLLIREWIYSNKVKYDRISLLRPDGGTVSIDIAKSDVLNSEAPIVIFLHTITGSSNTTNSFVSYALKRGWRAIVFNRRGHDSPLTSPAFNLMGDVDDTVAMVKHIKTIFPTNKFMTGIGISAGSGQIISYIGREGSKVDLSAAVSLCPAYDISQAFGNLDVQYPKVASLLLKRIKNFFLHENYEILQTMPGFQNSLYAKSLHDFAQAASHMAGAESWSDYLLAHNPMTHFEKSKIPCLVLNSLDDPVCVKENIPEFSIQNYMLVLTKHGSHIAFAEGITGRKSWMERISMDFLEACLIQSTALDKKHKKKKKQRT